MTMGLQDEGPMMMTCVAEAPFRSGLVTAGWCIGLLTDFDISKQYPAGRLGK